MSLPDLGLHLGSRGGCCAQGRPNSLAFAALLPSLFPFPLPSFPFFLSLFSPPNPIERDLSFLLWLSQPGAASFAFP